jgi:hypothetical protein
MKLTISLSIGFKRSLRRIHHLLGLLPDSFKVSKCLRAQIELRADVYADLSRILSCDYAHCSSAPSYTTPYKLAEGDSSNNKHRS